MPLGARGNESAKNGGNGVMAGGAARHSKLKIGNRSDGYPLWVSIYLVASKTRETPMVLRRANLR